VKGDSGFQKLVLFGDQAKTPLEAIWVFSDRERANRAQSQLIAQGEQLGPYEDCISGVKVFSKLSQFSFQKLIIRFWFTS
jgi:hypothetical protein